MFYVYILRCNDSRLYVGCTADLKNRITKHNKGYIPVTKCRLPVKLICYIAVETKYKAYKLEKYFKSGSGRAFINKHLIED